MELLEKDGRDPRLWRIAQKRASFKRNAYAWVLVNAFLWFIWWASSDYGDWNGIPWPVWPMAGWGVGLMFQYFDAYEGNRYDVTEKEYDKLKKEQERLKQS